MKANVKILISLLVLCGGYGISWGIGPREGVKYYKCGLCETAKAMLLNDLKAGGDGMAEVCYYLGEIYAGKQQVDSALYYYDKGLAADPLYAFNMIGKGKVVYAKNPDVAENLFSEALSGKNKRNSSILLAVAQAYDANHSDKADGYLQKAKEADEHNADIFIYEGDRLMKEQKNGDACSRYEQAVYFDPSCTEGYVKYARIYANTNPQIGLDMLQKLAVKDSESLIAPREMADIYYNTSRYQEAADAYDRCINSPYSTDRDMVRYATVLFYHGKYERSLKLAEQILQRDPKNVVMKRIRMYNLYQLKDYAQGIVAAKDFFATTPASDFIGQDYLFYSRILMAEKQLRQAVPMLEQALALDSTKTDLYKELATAYEKMNCYDTAANYYARFISKGGRQVSLADYFMLGKCHYYAADAADSTETGMALRKSNLQIADSVFGVVAEKAPDSYLGNFWRARVNSTLDPETEAGLAKPYYEAAAAILEKSDKNQNLLIECYSYLGYYQYLKGAMADSKAYWNKILAIDPQNEVATKALDGIK